MILLVWCAQVEREQLLDALPHPEPVWKASLDSQSKSVALDFSDTGHYNRSVTVNRVKVMFVKQGDGLSFAVIPSPNASLNGLQLSCTDMLHSVSSSCVLDNFFGELQTTFLFLLGS